MPTTLQTYNETTNLEYEALYIAFCCLQQGIPFAINPPQSEEDDRYTCSVYYNDDNADIIMDMDNNLKSGDYTGHGLNFVEFNEALATYNNSTTI